MNNKPMTSTQELILREIRAITAEKQGKKIAPDHVMVIKDQLKARTVPRLTLEEFGYELYEMYMQGMIDVGNTINDNWVRSIVVDSEL